MDFSCERTIDFAFNQSVVRLGAENTGGEDFASFGSDLTARTKWRRTQNTAS